tara:strand:+ start:661 stop:1419 length:759 start_codon:yes stop_codon:yes gene_type:complete
MKKVVVSGGFDPVHVGHLELLKNAKKLGDYLIIILNTDKFLLEKKGFVFMPYTERKKILLGFRYVDKVIKCIDKDNTVSLTLEYLKKNGEVDIFANGGDRKNIKDIPEFEICKKNGIQMKFDVGGGKVQSSSDLVKKFLNFKEKRPWGFFENLLEEKNYKVKKLTVHPGQKISFQFHKYRNEKWFAIKGKGLVHIEDKKLKFKKGLSFEIMKGEKHSVENTGKSNLEIIEIQFGKKVLEEDIVRLKDIYGRV